MRSGDQRPEPARSGRARSGESFVSFINPRRSSSWHDSDVRRAQAARTEPAQSIALSFPADARRTVPGPFLCWVVVFWLTGASVFSLRLQCGWIAAERLRSRMVRPASIEWQRIFDRLKTRIRISRPVRLLVSGRVQAPAAMGWLRPII